MPSSQSVRSRSTATVRVKDVSNKKLELDRIVFFSDAVFAIAITLLAFNLKLPTHSAYLSPIPLSRALLAIIPKVQSYTISFLAIGFYWMSHHDYFRYIKRYDSVLIWLNIGFLMCIAFLPFPTAVLDDYRGQRLAIAFYAGSMAMTGLMKASLWGYASRKCHLVSRSLPPRLVRSLTIRTLVPPLVFLGSIAIAYFNPDLAELSWLSILAYWLGLRMRSL